MSLSILDKDDPKPFTIATLTLYLRDLLDKDHKPYDLSGCSKIRATIKDALTDADGAHATIDSVTHPTQFVLTYASTGNIDVIFSSTNTNLTAGTLYYVDVVALWAAGTKVVLCNDTIKFQSVVTQATS